MLITTTPPMLNNSDMARLDSIIRSCRDIQRIIQMSTFHEGVSKNGYSGRVAHLRDPAGLIGYSSGEFFVYELDFLLDFGDIGLKALYATAHVAHQ